MDTFYRVGCAPCALRLLPTALYVLIPLHVLIASAVVSLYPAKPVKHVIHSSQDALNVLAQHFALFPAQDFTFQMEAVFNVLRTAFYAMTLTLAMNAIAAITTMALVAVVLYSFQDAKAALMLLPALSARFLCSIITVEDALLVILLIIVVNVIKMGALGVCWDMVLMKIVHVLFVK